MIVSFPQPAKQGYRSCLSLCFFLLVLLESTVSAYPQFARQLQGRQETSLLSAIDGSIVPSVNGSPDAATQPMTSIVPAATDPATTIQKTTSPADASTLYSIAGANDPSSTVPATAGTTRTIIDASDPASIIGVGDRQSSRYSTTPAFITAAHDQPSTLRTISTQNNGFFSSTAKATPKSSWSLASGSRSSLPLTSTTMAPVSAAAAQPTSFITGMASTAGFSSLSTDSNGVIYTLVSTTNTAGNTTTSMVAENLLSTNSDFQPVTSISTFSISPVTTNILSTAPLAAAASVSGALVPCITLAIFLGFRW